MKLIALVCIAAASATVGVRSLAATTHRSQVRIRDPFVLPEPESKTYYIYSSTDWGSEAEQQTKAVIVYRSKDLENWETPIPVFQVPRDHWARESIWAPEVHRYQGPWEQQEQTLWLDDGGHPMLFTTFDGRLVMTLHQPNRRVERARFFEMDDTGDTIQIRREIVNFTSSAR